MVGGEVLPAQWRHSTLRIADRVGGDPPRFPTGVASTAPRPLGQQRVGRNSLGQQYRSEGKTETATGAWFGSPTLNHHYWGRLERSSRCRTNQAVAATAQSAARMLPIALLRLLQLLPTANPRTVKAAAQIAHPTVVIRMNGAQGIRAWPAGSEIKERARGVSRAKKTAPVP